MTALDKSAWISSLFVWICLVPPLAAEDVGEGVNPLASQLASEDPANLGRAAREQGDARRGALVFYQDGLACAKCHLAGERTRPLGPDLAKLDKDVTAAYLVESVLDPSKSIKKEYATVTVVTDDGRTLTGLLAEERPDAIIIRDPSQDGALVTIAKSHIDERNDKGPSLMPAGLAGQMASRQQFLDLVRYLLEIAEGGPARAAALRPDPVLLTPPPLPVYERDIDHAGLIAGLGQANYRRGEAVYQRVCANCHGTKDRPGSLPTSLRFASGTFKNGSDPFRMYQTLTRGFGTMPPQTWMVPRQKYDVIHYIRESLLKKDNPGQYARVDRDYLAKLPKGSSQGPEPTVLEPWVTMDYGPSLSATYEVGDDETNFAYKGIAVRLDPGPGGVSRGSHWAVYDHDTMRLAATWNGQGFIDWNGINFNGRHEIHPRIVGRVGIANPDGLGWANPDGGGFADLRLKGRDGRRYGPLPKSWTHFRGLYHHGHRVVLSYTIGDAAVLEMPGLEPAPAATAVTRTFNIGPRVRDLELQVAHHSAANASLRLPKSGGGREGAIAILGTDEPAKPPDAALLRFDGTTAIDVTRPDGLDLAHRDYALWARIKTTRGGSLFSESATQGPWIPNGKAWFVRGGRLVFDIGWVGAVESRGRVDDGQWHDVAMTFEHATGQVRLYRDGKLDGQGRLKPRGDVADRVLRIGYTAPDFPEEMTYFHGEIADLRLLPTAPGPIEVAALSKPSGAAPSLLARWRFTAEPDGRIRDESGHGRDGRLVNDPGSRDKAAWIVADVSPALPGLHWNATGDGNLRLKIAAGAAPLKFTVRTSRVEKPHETEAAERGRESGATDLTPLTHGGGPRWPGALVTKPTLGRDDGPFAVDVLTHPESNPWLCQMRFTGFDFYADGKAAAVCTWDGDVWKVDGVDRPENSLSWRRIASGLFQPLGLKIVDGRIYVSCRDQIAWLHDLDGDGEADFYENFNDDHQVTEHFHEFAMDLQTDPAGNFYYAKAARHGKTAVVPQHGTLLRVSRDGARTEILATGFRAPNGVCLNADGTFFLTDQEGFWTPKNRINWVKPGGFYGNMWGFHDVTDTSDDAMEPPLCWITNAIDRSPAQMLRVKSDAWGPLKESLLSLSYGYGKIFVVPHERIGDRMQGGVCALPIPPFPTGVMRGRFHPGNGQLYALGMYAWAGTQTKPGGIYRVRYTGKPVVVPTGLSASKRGMTITFASPLNREAAVDAGRYTASTWSLKRSERYGSEHINERVSPIARATLSDDARTVFLEMPAIRPTWGMEIRYTLKGVDGMPIEGVIHNTIHQLRE